METPFRQLQKRVKDLEEISKGHQEQVGFLLTQLNVKEKCEFVPYKIVNFTFSFNTIIIKILVFKKISFKFFTKKKFLVDLILLYLFIS